MNRRRVSLLLMGALGLGGLAGCRCPGERVNYVPPPRGMVGTCDRCAANGPMPPRFTPNTTPVVPAPPPPAVAAPPPGAVTLPPGIAPPPPGQAYAPPSTAIQQNAYNPPSPPSAPSGGAAAGAYLEQPEPIVPQPAKPMPNSDAPTPPTPPTQPTTPQSPEPPPAREDRGASPALPVDIPQFAMVKTNIASGLEPFAEGVTWLKAHGYRTVLHIRPASEDDRASRRRFEQSGLRYLSLEVSPQTLSRALVDQFKGMVADANNLPLFVYDADASLAGALWYLHFRLVDRATEEKAREEAEHLGFKKDRGDAHLKMWLAVQGLLQDGKPE